MFKCLYCDHYLPNRNAFSQHVKYCKELNISTEESNNDISDMISSINEISFDSEYFSRIKELQSIREENLPQVSSISYQYESNSSYAGDISFHSSNIPEEFENFDEILSDSLQHDANMKDIPKEFENLDDSLQHNANMRDIPEEFENLDEILPESLQSNVEESEVEIKEFPNETYTDLMTLITENNFSNKAGNAIIKFFNKHLDLSQSPLPKNIEAGRNFMDKMNISQLSHSKYCILNHNGQDYFIHYRPIKIVLNIITFYV